MSKNFVYAIEEGLSSLIAGIKKEAEKLAVTNPESSLSLLLLIGYELPSAKILVEEWLGDRFSVMFKGDRVRLLRDISRAEVYGECDTDCEEILYSTGIILTVENLLLYNSTLKSYTDGVGVVCTDGDTIHTFNLKDVRLIS